MKIIKKRRIVSFHFGCGGKNRHGFIAIQRQQLFRKVYFPEKKKQRKNADVNVALMPRTKF
jgi:hypothetical protein